VTSSKPSARKIGVTSIIVISLLQFGQISLVGTMEGRREQIITRALRRGLVGGRGVNWKLDQAYLQPTRNCLIVT
jgi:hypothetical protein